MAKRVIVNIDPSDLKTVGSGVLPEIQKLSYPANSIGMANSKTYYIAGKKYISQFVAAMLEEIEECSKMFTDEQSAAEFECDRAYLKSLLEVKAK